MNTRDFAAHVCILVGVLLVVVAEGLYWHDSIIALGFRAISMPLLSRAVYPAPTFCLFSYGTAILLLLGIAFVASRVRRPIPIAWCAFFLVLLGILFPLQIGFFQPTWLDQYWNCHLQYTQLTGFAGQNSLPDVGPAVESSSLLGIDGLYDRLAATMMSLKIGWTFHLAGSLLFFVGALAFVGRWEIVRPHAICGGIILILLLFVNLIGPMTAEAFWRSGLQAERAGNLENAKRYYHWALTLDQWNRLNPRVYQRLGSIAEAEHRTSSPEYHFLMGIRNTNWNNPDIALSEFKLATASKDSALADLADDQYVKTAADQALNLYHKGSPGVAALYWQQAATHKGVHAAENYLAARGLQDTGQYGPALTALASAKTTATDLLLQSQIYNSLGDVYYLRKDVLMGRQEYLSSIAVIQSYIEYKNIRAQKGLTDNLQP